MKKFIGNFIEIDEHKSDYLRICFSPTHQSLQKRWRNSGLSANFMADYFSTFFPDTDPESQEKQLIIKDSISYVANELIENAMKFSYAPNHYSIFIHMYLYADKVIIYVMNSVDPKTIPAFQSHLQKLLSEDANKLYMQRLMFNAEADGESDVLDPVADTVLNGDISPVDSDSGLGYLTILNDYEGQIAWKFDEHDERQDEGQIEGQAAQSTQYLGKKTQNEQVNVLTKFITVTTMVELKLSALIG
ncbi:MAG: ATP-binding protein [Chloroflexota bacterium]